MSAERKNVTEQASLFTANQKLFIASTPSLLECDVVYEQTPKQMDVKFLQGMFDPKEPNPFSNQKKIL